MKASVNHPSDKKGVKFIIYSWTPILRDLYGLFGRSSEDNLLMNSQLKALSNSCKVIPECLVEKTQFQKCLSSFWNIYLQFGQ